MLKKIGFSSVISNQGYKIEFAREIIKYSEGNRTMYINRPAGDNVDNLIYIELSSIDNWLAPHEEEIISEDRRKEILDRVIEMVVFLGYKYKLI